VEALGLVKIWRTLLFAVVAVSLGLYIWLVEKPRMAAEGAPDTLVQFDPVHVARLHLAYPQAPSLTLIKDKDHWRLTEPIQADADDEAVKRLLDQIANTKAERRIPKAEAEELGTYGLDGNGTRARVSMTLDDGAELPDIVLGNTTPVGFQAFAHVDGKDEVILVPLLLHTGINKTPFDLRQKKMFPIEPANATGATLTNGGTTVDLEREGDRWKITSPVQDEADPDQVGSLLRSLNEISAEAYYDGAEADRKAFGLTSPTLTFQARFGDGNVAGFRLGGKTTESPPGYYLERISDGQVAAVPQWVQVRFAQDVNALRDKRVFHCEQGDIGKISFERRDGASFAITKDEKGMWEIEPDQDRPVQNAVADRLLAGIATLAGKDIVAESADTPEKLAPYGLDAPTVQVEATNNAGQSCGKALAAVVGETTETPKYFVKRADTGTVMSIPAYLYSRLKMRSDDLLEPKKDPAPATPAAQQP